MKFVPGTQNTHYLPLLFSLTLEKSQCCAKCKLKRKSLVKDSRVHNTYRLIMPRIHTELVVSFSGKNKGHMALDQFSSFYLDYSIDLF